MTDCCIIICGFLAIHKFMYISNLPGKASYLFRVAIHKAAEQYGIFFFKRMPAGCTGYNNCLNIISGKELNIFYGDLLCSLHITKRQQRNPAAILTFGNNHIITEFVQDAYRCPADVLSGKVYYTSGEKGHCTFYLFARRLLPLPATATMR